MRAKKNLDYLMTDASHHYCETHIGIASLEQVVNHGVGASLTLYGTLI